MKEYTEEEIIEKYKELPSDVRGAIFAVDSIASIEEIGKKYKLSVDKIGNLSNEIRMLMLGITEPPEFIPNISRRLGVDKNIAREITKEVNEKIFSKIRESLKKIHNIKEEAEERGGGQVEETAKPAPVEPPVPKGLDRNEILKGIENPETIQIPPIFQRNVKADVSSAPMKPGISRRPPEVSEHNGDKSRGPGGDKYPEGDPYREPVR